MALETKSKTTSAPLYKNVAEALVCQLSVEEWRDRANALADAHRAVEQQEEAKKTVVAELNSGLKVAKAHESKLATIVATHREVRDVTVKVKYDYDMGTVTRVRTDTEEVIGERKMTDDERQSSLLDGEEFLSENYEEGR